MGHIINTEKYDPQTDTWTTEQPMLTGRHGFGAVTLNNKIYLIGGGEKPGASVITVNEIFVVSP
jgi:N-acetylneuraminic acid mutarotase